MNLRLRTLLAASFAGFAAFALAAAAAVILLARDGQESASYLVISVRSVESAEKIALELHELEHVSGAPADAAEQALLRDVAFNRAMIQSPAEGQIVVRLEGAIATLKTARAALAAEPQSQEKKAAMGEALARAHVEQSQLLQINLEQAREAEALTTRHGLRATRAAMGVAALLIAAMAALIWLVRSQLIRPLDSLREDIHRLALGEAGVRARERQTVEMRELASTFNQMAALLDEQRRGRAEILGRVAGALESPLGSLRVALENLSPGAPLPREDELRKLHAQVIRCSLQLEQRVVEFLDAARAEAGELPLSRARCDLRDLVRESVELFRGVSPAHSLELQAGGPVPARADAARVSQVLHALLALALRRAPGGGRIEVKLDTTPALARLSISARETSIPTGFEALFNDLRGLSNALRDVPGVLFGLDVSRKLIEAHGGRIQVDGQGSRYLLELPLALSGDDEAQPETRALPSSTASPAAQS